jgi:hypothetical protein
MGSLRQELYFWYLLNRQWEALMLLKLANYHNLLNYQFGFNRYYTSYYRNVLKLQQLPFHFGRLMFMKGLYDTALMSIGKVVAIATLFKLLLDHECGYFSSIPTHRYHFYG